MTTNFDTDPNTQTVAAAWASSPLGQPEREVRFGFAPTGPTEAVADDEPRPDRKKAILAAALGAGVIAGSGIGVMLFDYTDSAQPTVVVPRSESRLPSPPVAPPTPARPAIDNAPAPNSVVPQQRTGPAPVAPSSGQGPADVGTPPASTDSQPTVVVDIPIPDYPPLPEKPQEDPEPEPPQPPDVPDLDFKLPQLGVAGDGVRRRAHRRTRPDAGVVEPEDRLDHPHRDQPVGPGQQLTSATADRRASPAPTGPAACHHRAADPQVYGRQATASCGPSGVRAACTATGGAAGARAAGVASSRLAAVATTGLATTASAGWRRPHRAWRPDGVHAGPTVLSDWVPVSGSAN